MASRHKVQGRAEGGRVYYSGGNSNVASEAKSKTESFKSGGKVSGGKGKMRMDKRARGGGVFSSAHKSEKGNLT